MAAALKTLILYAAKDHAFGEEIERHLAGLRRERVLHVSHCKLTREGVETSQASLREIAVARLLLVLVSPDLLDAALRRDRALSEALSRHAAGAVRMVPVIVRRCDWSGAPFGELSVLPDNQLPIAKWADRDDAWVHVVSALREIVIDFAGAPDCPAPEDTEGEAVFGSTGEDTSFDPEQASHPVDAGSAGDDPQGPLPGWLRPFWDVALRVGLPYQNAHRSAVDRYLKHFIDDMRYQNGTVLAPGQYVDPRATRPTAVGGVYSAQKNVRSSADRHVNAHLREIIGLQDGGTRATAELAVAEHQSRLIRDVLSRLTETQHPIVLLAEPGFGKSMTLRQVGLLLAGRGRRVWAPRIPIYVRLGEFRTPRPDARHVLAFVRHQLASKSAELSPAFDCLLRDGRLVLLLDGMDEMDRVDYPERVRALSDFAASHGAACKMLFACRTNDFIPTFKQHQMALLPFDERQIRLFLRKNLFSDERGHQIAVRVANRWYRWWQAAQLAELLRAPLGDALGSPLMLALSSAYLAETQSIPTARRELFLWFIDQLLVRLRARAQAPRDVDASRVVRAWGLLAFVITRYAAGTVIDRDELLRHFGEAEPDSVRWGLEAGLLLQYSGLDAGSPPSYAFVHHRIQEYLTAHYVSTEAADEVDFWRDVLDVPRWQEVLLHLATIVNGPHPAFQALHGALELPPPGGDPLEESDAADRIILAARVAATSQACMSREDVITALEEMAERGRPTSQMRALQASVHLEGGAETICPLLRDSEISWVRRQARVVEAHADRKGRKDPRLDLGPDVFNGEFWKVAPDYFFLVRQKGTRRWLPAFVAGLLAWGAGAVASHGLPLAAIVLTLTIDGGRARVWSFVVASWWTAATYIVCSGGVAVLVRARWFPNALQAQLATIIGLFSLLMTVEAAAKGPTGALLIALSCVGAAPIMGMLAVCVGVLVRFVCFALIGSLNSWTAENLGVLARRAIEAVKDALEKPAMFAAGFGLMVFWFSSFCAGTAGGKFKVPLPAAITFVLDAAAGAVVLIGFTVVVGIPWLFRFVLKIPEYLREYRWKAPFVLIGLVVVVALALGLSGVLSFAVVGGGGWVFEKASEAEKTTPVLKEYGAKGLLGLVVLVALFFIFKLLGPPLRRKAQELRERRRAIGVRKALDANVVVERGGASELAQWEASFRQVLDPGVQVDLLERLRVVATSGKGNTRAILACLQAVEKSVLPDPAASTYWQIFEEVLSIERQRRRLGTGNANDFETTRTRIL